ncbi:pseudouridine synthase [Paenibacillus sp. CAU 1782]
MTERLRIDKLLAHSGCGTRSEIKRYVKAGMVTVDGITVKDSGLIVNPSEQVIAFQGEQVHYRSVVYFMLNKPQGVISATEDARDKTVIDLLKPEDTLPGPFPVGRLDKDTVGLLLLTNDGALAHDLLSPRKHVVKTYEATVRGKVTGEDIAAFSEGVELEDGYMTMPAELQILNADSDEEGDLTYISLKIKEGKFHQVKRMFQAVGKTVLTLKRVTMGPLVLDEELAEGQYRELSQEELLSLKELQGGKQGKA